MSDKLKPCPFCGSTDLLLIKPFFSIHRNDRYVVCNNCKSNSGIYSGESMAIGAWNARTTDRTPIQKAKE